MVNLTPEIAAEIVATCQANAESVEASIGSALGGAFAITVGETAPYNASEAPEGFQGPGLAILLRFGEVGAVAVLPESSGQLPDWYSSPDATGKAKLSTLAQELGMLLVPETFAPDEFDAARVDVLSTALRRARVAAGAVYVPLAMERDGKSGQLTFIWPIAEPASLLANEEVAEVPEEKGATGAHDGVSESTTPTEAPEVARKSTFTSNVLRITVPVTVRLAAQRTPIREIIELGPGSIVKFEKTCEEPLDLCVGERRIAVGEVVKVGDKFGLRIGELVGAPAESST